MFSFWNQNQSGSCAETLHRRSTCIQIVEANLLSMAWLLYRAKYLEAYTASQVLGARQVILLAGPESVLLVKPSSREWCPSTVPLCLGGAVLADLEERRGAVARRRRGNTGQEEPFLSLLTRVKALETQCCRKSHRRALRLQACHDTEAISVKLLVPTSSLHIPLGGRSLPFRGFFLIQGHP